MALSAKEALKWLKEWQRKRNINPLDVAVERMRKEARYENETYGAGWIIPFDVND